MSYPELSAMLGGYFHQDWDLEQDSLSGVVANFVSTTDPAVVRATAAEADDFLKDHPSDLLAAFERAFRPEITIGQNDDEARDWLRWLAGELRGRLLEQHDD